jgi:hypothetical protein
LVDVLDQYIGVTEGSEDTSGQLRPFLGVSRGAKPALDERTEVPGKHQRLLRVVDCAQFSVQLRALGER